MRAILKIYECGKMGGLSFEEANSWRAELKMKLMYVAQLTGCELEVINPLEYYNHFNNVHQSEEEVQDFDLYHVKSSDIIVVNLAGLSSSDGTKIELHDANYNNRIPVIAFGDKELYNNLHPWIKRCITRREESMDDVVVYIRDFYMT